MSPVGEEHNHQQWRHYEQEDIHQVENLVEKFKNFVIFLGGESQ